MNSALAEQNTGEDALAEIRKRLATIAESRRKHEATGDLVSGAEANLGINSLQTFIAELSWPALYEAMVTLATDALRGARLAGVNQLSARACRIEPGTRIRSGKSTRHDMDILNIPFSESVSRRDDLVAGLIPNATMGLISGPAGCGKTTLAVSLAIAVAGGKPWAGGRRSSVPW